MFVSSAVGAKIAIADGTRTSVTKVTLEYVIQMGPTTKIRTKRGVASTCSPVSIAVRPVKSRKLRYAGHAGHSRREKELLVNAMAVGIVRTKCNANNNL